MGESLTYNLTAENYGNFEYKKILFDASFYGIWHDADKEVEVKGEMPDRAPTSVQFGTQLA